MRRTEAKGDQQLFEKIKVFLKNQKHEPNIVKITHLCIMHGAHTSPTLLLKYSPYGHDSSKTYPEDFSVHKD